MHLTEELKANVRAVAKNFHRIGIDGRVTITIGEHELHCSLQGTIYVVGYQLVLSSFNVLNHTSEAVIVAVDAFPTAHEGVTHIEGKDEFLNIERITKIIETLHSKISPT